jgi:hypothetical protein
VAAVTNKAKTNSFGVDPENGLALLGPSILGMAFGAIHFIAWWYTFPSHAEFILWRISCIALVAVPLLSAITCVGWATDMGNIDNALVVIIYLIPVLLLILSAWLYIVARVASLVIAFTALRSLPSDAFLVVDWTTFIPHI